jgi:hypothetical protein
VRRINLDHEPRGGFGIGDVDGDFLSRGLGEDHGWIWTHHMPKNQRDVPDARNVDQDASDAKRIFEVYHKNLNNFEEKLKV